MKIDAWAVKHRHSDRIMINTVSHSKGLAIKKFLAMYGMDRGWVKFQQKGHRIAKVQIVWKDDKQKSKV